VYLKKMAKIQLFFNKAWLYKYDLIYWGLLFSALGLDWVSSRRLGILPSKLSWTPDLFIAAAALLLAGRLLLRRSRMVHTAFTAPLLFIFSLSVVSAVLNQQQGFNFLYGFWIYFRYVFWFCFLTIAPLQVDFSRSLPYILVFLSFLQIPLTLVQRYVLDLDKDLISGTVAGTQRMALILIMGFYAVFSSTILKGKNRWVGMLGLLFLIPTALGEARGMYFIFPVALVFLLFILWQKISWQFASAVFIAGLMFNLLTLPLYPSSARSSLIEWTFNPLKMLSDQGQFSVIKANVDGKRVVVQGKKEIPDAAINDPNQLAAMSDGHALGRVAGIKFVVLNANTISKGGLLLGSGMGATLESSFPAGSGAIYNKYPDFDLERLPLTMVLTELGILGLAGYAWLLIVAARTAFFLYKQTESHTQLTGIIAAGAALSVCFGFFYTNFFFSQPFMFMASTIFAAVAKKMIEIDNQRQQGF
jgi:hypothetical protein